MIKISTNIDPIQQKLRDNKKIWNKKVSEFADNIFRFKDMMNGKPSKFYSQKSSIKDPIPGDPATIIGVLAHDFQEIVQKGNDIVKQQVEYSKNRRKAKPKQNGNLSTQLASNENYHLISLASNPFSRFFARLLNTTFGDSEKSRIKKYRMSLLKSTEETYKDIVKFQIAIVESSPDSIFTASKILFKIKDNWTFFNTGLDAYKGSRAEEQQKIKVQQIEGKSNLDIVDKDKQSMISNTSNILQIDEIILDCKKNLANFLDLNSKELVKSLSKWKSTWKNTVNSEEKEKFVQNIKIEYENILNQLRMKYSVSGNSLAEIWNSKQKKEANSNYLLETVAEKGLIRWINKKRHQMSSSDKTSAQRLESYNKAEELKVLLDKLMDSLEKELNWEFLNSTSNSINQLLTEVQKIVFNLEETVRGKNFETPFIDGLNDHLITNFNPNLDSEQKEHLQKMIEKRRLRELTNLYQK